jgi:hypothetical protein
MHLNTRRSLSSDCQRRPGPAQAEQARGLKFASSGATGFKILSISGGVARVQLTGKRSSGGSTFTIASEITPTLKQFASVHWVKIYDQIGQRDRPGVHGLWLTSQKPGDLYGRPSRTS